MKIIIKDLRKHIKNKGLTIAEFIRRLNTLQEILAPGKRVITRQSIYFYLQGVSPPEDRIYMMAALLDVTPQELCALEYNKTKDAHTKSVAKNYLIK